LRANPFYAEAEGDRGLMPSREFQRIHVPGPDGVFRLVAYPGPGLLIGLLQGNTPRYLPGRVDPADVAKAQGDPIFEFAKQTGVYRLIDPKDGDPPLTVDMELEPRPPQSGGQ
jgi:hypothetical protein